MTHRFFKPYEGSEYRNGLRDGRRLLVVGESHYGKCNPDTTTDVVKGHMAENDLRFLSHIESTANGFQPLERIEFWQSVAFCNFVQQPMDDAYARPSHEQFRNSWSAMAETIVDLDPDLIFVYSKQSWDYFPYELGGGARHRSHSVKPTTGAIWQYHRLDRPLYAAVFNHPSRTHAPVDVWKAWAEFCWSKAV